MRTLLKLGLFLWVVVLGMFIWWLVDTNGQLSTVEQDLIDHQTVIGQYRYGIAPIWPFFAILVPMIVYAIGMINAQQELNRREPCCRLPMMMLLPAIIIFIIMLVANSMPLEQNYGGISGGIWTSGDRISADGITLWADCDPTTQLSATTTSPGNQTLVGYTTLFDPERYRTLVLTCLDYGEYTNDYRSVYKNRVWMSFGFALVTFLFGAGSIAYGTGIGV